MSCNSCAKNTERIMINKLKLSATCLPEKYVEEWVALRLPSIKLPNINEDWGGIEEFTQEVCVLLQKFDLVTILKKMTKDNKEIVNILCVMAYLGLLNVDERDDVWYWEQKGGNTVAHWAAKGGTLNFPYDSVLWLVKNKKGETPLHWLTKSKKQLNIPCDSDLWYVRDNEGKTLAHWAAQAGLLLEPYSSKLWYIQDKQGVTPLHCAAEFGHLNAPYESELWCIQDNLGGTPAHCAARNGFLSAPYNYDLWRIQDKTGWTPAHSAATKGFLKAPWDSDLWNIRDKSYNTPAHWMAVIGLLDVSDDSELWYTQNIYGSTPAHRAAEVGRLNVSYDSALWYIKDVGGDTPAHLAAKNGFLMAPYDSELWSIQNLDGDTPLHYLVENYWPVNVSYRSSAWLVVNKRKQSPADLVRDTLMVSLHHPDKTIVQYFESKVIDFKYCQSAWDVLGYIRASLLTNQYDKLVETITCQPIPWEREPQFSSLCDFRLALKNASQPYILRYILSATHLCDIYCRVMVDSLFYLLETNNEKAVDVIFKSNHPYINDSIYSRFSEYKLWQSIVYIMREKYGVSFDGF